MPSLRSAPGPPRRLTHLALVALVALAALAAHLPALQAGIMFDDAEVLQADPRLARGAAVDWSGLLLEGYWPDAGADRLWRPLPLLSLGVQQSLGHGPGALHGLNLLLHAGVAAALFLFILGLGAPRGVALAAALLFAVHPLGSEAVTLVVGRSDLLMALCSLACLRLLFPAEGRGNAVRLLAAALLAALACGSKESGFTLPLLAGLCLFLGRRRHGAAQPRPALLALTVVGVAAALVLMARVVVLDGLMRSGPPPLANNPLAHAGPVAGRLEAMRLLLRAAHLFVWPASLSVDYSHAAITAPAVDLEAVIAALAGMAALGLLLWLLRRRPLALLGGLFFLVAHALTANIIVPIGTVFAERLLYLPMAGLCLLAADLGGALAAWMGRRGWQRQALVAAIIVAAAVLAALGGRTWVRERNFRDDLTLWQATVAAEPMSAKGHYNLGRSLAARGRHPEAAGEYEQALRIQPDHIPALNNLGSTRLRLNDAAAALLALSRAAALAPGSAPVAFNHTLALARLGRTGEAAAEFKRARLLDPDTARGLLEQGEPWRGLSTPSP